MAFTDPAFTFHKRIGILMISVAFLIAPLFVVGMRMITTEGQLIIGLSLWLWIFSSFFAAVFVWFSYKRIWALSFFQFFVTSLIQVFDFELMQPVFTSEQLVQVFLSISTLVMVFLVSQNFGLLFFDRRDSWIFGVTKRHEISTEATLNGTVLIQTINVSSSGIMARYFYNPHHHLMRMMYLDIPELKVINLPVSFVSLHGDHLKLEFVITGLSNIFQVRKMNRTLQKLAIEKE